MNFKQIIEHPSYGVSECGIVKNLSTGKILKNNPNGKGYLLFNAGSKYKLSIHRQVAKLYIPNPDNLPVVNHKDGNKLNNHFSNLEWATHSGNTLHAYEIGLIKPPGLGKFGKLNCKSKAIQQFALNGQLVAEWESANQAKREMGFHDGTISMVCNGKLKTHKGFIFRFKESA